MEDRTKQVAQAREWFAEWCMTAAAELESFAFFIGQKVAKDEEFMERIRILDETGPLAFLDRTGKSDPSLDDLRKAMTGIR